MPLTRGRLLRFVNGTVIFPLIYAVALYTRLAGNVVYGTLLGVVPGGAEPTGVSFDREVLDSPVPMLESAATLRQALRAAAVG